MEELLHKKSNSMVNLLCSINCMFLTCSVCTLLRETVCFLLTVFACVKFLPLSNSVFIHICMLDIS